MMKKILTALLFLTTILFMGPRNTAFAEPYSNSKESPETVDTQLQFLYGDWYDMQGNFAFTAFGRIIKGAEVTGGRNFVGGTSFGAGIFETEKAGRRSDLPWATRGEGMHSLLILHGTEVYRRTREPQYKESVNGIYLGITDTEVRETLGLPSFKEKDGQRWVYPDWGLTVDFGNGVASAVTLINENGRLDSTGLGLFSTVEELQRTYNLTAEEPYPGATITHRGVVAEGEMMLLMTNPKSICLTVYMY